MRKEIIFVKIAGTWTQKKGGGGELSTMRRDGGFFFSPEEMLRLSCD